MVYKIVAEEPAIVHRLNPSLSPGIDAVIRKALSKKADGRYRSCIDFINALGGRLPPGGRVAKPGPRHQPQYPYRSRTGSPYARAQD